MKNKFHKTNGARGKLGASVLHDQLSGQGADNKVQHYPNTESRPQSQGDAGRHGGHQQDGGPLPQRDHAQVQEERYDRSGGSWGHTKQSS